VSNRDANPVADIVAVHVANRSSNISHPNLQPDDRSYSHPHRDSIREADRGTIGVANELDSVHVTNVVTDLFRPDGVALLVTNGVADVCSPDGDPLGVAGDFRPDCQSDPVADHLADHLANKFGPDLFSDSAPNKFEPNHLTHHLTHHVRPNHVSNDIASNIEPDHFPDRVADHARSDHVAVATADTQPNRVPNCGPQPCRRPFQLHTSQPGRQQCGWWASVQLRGQRR